MAHPNLVFMGVSGCGKSTVAEMYAQRTGATLIEADVFHPPANIAKMSSGIPLTDEDRAGWLAAMADRLADGKARGEAMVVTCSALKKAYRDRLRQGDPDLFFVFLDGSQELLQARLDARKGHFMPPGLLGSQLATLERPNLATERCLHVSISLSPEQICATVAVAMRRFA
jgi:gluconokinase